MKRIRHLISLPPLNRYCSIRRSFLSFSLGKMNSNGSRSLSSSGDDDVLFEEIGKVGVITLNRPKALNAFNLSMSKKIHPQLKKWQSEVAFILIKGSGEKAFCAGGDIRAVTEKEKKAEALEFFKNEYITNYTIGTLKIPYVALIHGITMGGGVGLSIHGTYRVATEKTVFAMPETAIGLFPDVGASYILPRLPNPLGAYYGLTGFRLTGLDVMKAGIATHFCDLEKLSSLEQELLALPDATGIQTVLDKYTRQSLDGKDREFVLQVNKERIRKHFTADSIEKIVQSLQSDHSPWGKQHLENLMKMSPTSLKITLHELIEGNKLSLKECLQMEYRMVVRVMDGSDFYEGVRAVLVDRDNKPVWNPAKLEDVTREKVAAYFARLPPEQELQLD